MSTTNRDEKLDLIRGLAMVGIVLIHVHSYFLFFHSIEDIPVIITMILANISRFSVPVFILAAGLFSRDRTFLSYWQSRILLVIIPYCIASTIGYFVKFNDWDAFDFLYKLLMGKVFTPYYFIPLLFQFYIIHYFLLRKANEMSRLILLIIALIINIISNAGYFAFMTNDYKPIWIGDFAFFYFLGFYLSEKKGINFLSDLPFLKWISAFGFICLLIYISWYTAADKIILTNHHLVYPTLAIIAIYSFIKLRLPLLESIGQNSLGIFLIHPFIIHMMHSIDPYSLGGGYISIILTTIVNVVVPWTIWLGVQRIIQLYSK
ncbi:acyltransferase [Leptospira sp. GIMC2001]|uniref:acyltransferase n=1 Tax=Leptospira sp. GIMC2001 TaxID=1513297 RepID=UPI00234B88FA|nr:acyltransferase [Leptospira sp. GIMC2001]WCL47711.1 acyltransferase [Leptospira sp. GIMC2001]